MDKKKKICPRCKRELGIECFNKNKSNKDGLGKYCRECVSLFGKEYRTKNQEKIKAKNKIYQDSHKEEHRIYEKKRMKIPLYREKRYRATRKYMEKKNKERKVFDIRNKEMIDWVNKGIEERNLIRKTIKRELELKKARKAFKILYDLNTDIYRELSKVKYQIGSDNLTDFYMHRIIKKTWLKKDIKLNNKDIPPELIILKRAIIKAKRELKKQKQLSV